MLLKIADAWRPKFNTIRYLFAMIVLSSPSSVELEPSSGVLEQKQADAYELKTAGRVAPSPVTGRNVSVSYVMRHPQFDADIVEDHETGVQFARRRVRSMFARRGPANRLEDGPPPQVDPPPSAAALARLYDVDYNDAYGRDLSPDAVIPPRVPASRATPPLDPADRPTPFLDPPRTRRTSDPFLRPPSTPPNVPS